MSGRLLKVQTLLLDTPDTTLKVCQVLDPAALMLEPPPQGFLAHSCVETIQHVYSSRPNQGRAPDPVPMQKVYQQ